MIEMMFRKYTLVVGVFAVVMLLLSTATAVPHIKGTIVSKKIKQAENTKLMLANNVFDKNNLDKILSKIKDTIDLEKLSKQAEKIKKTLEQKYGKEFVNKLDTTINKILDTLDIPEWLEKVVGYFFLFKTAFELGITWVVLLMLPLPIGPILTWILMVIGGLAVYGWNWAEMLIVIYILEKIFEGTEDTWEMLDNIQPFQQPNLQRLSTLD